MAKKKNNENIFSALTEMLQESIPSMDRSKRTKTVQVLQEELGNLFSMLPEEEPGTVGKKPKIVKMNPRKVQAKVRLWKSAKDRASKQAYISDVEPRKMLLKITLARVRPIVWRKVEVPSNISLEHLHTVIQAAFGWYDEHLHKFMVGDEDIEPKARGYAFDADYDSWLVALDEVLPSVGSSIKYLYDFGERWTHTIALESAVEYTAAERPHVCMTDGKGACPEEDGDGIQSFNKTSIMARVRGVKQPY